MDLRIKHTIGFAYDEPARASHLEARLTPPSDGRQAVRNTHIDVDPQPWSTSYTDYWGTRVTAFELLQPHPLLTVTATSTVRTAAAASPPGGLTWEDLADPRLLDELAEFLVVAEPPTLEMSTQVARLTGGPPSELAQELCRQVQDVPTVIDALREVGIPSRFVSGYVLGQAKPHTWLEWWDGVWQAFDPALGDAPGEGHVTRAVGRTASDVRALRGICTGSVVAKVLDEVDVTRL